VKVVAFAYADAIPRLSALYRGLAEGLCQNVRQVMPGVEIVHVSDKDTAPLEGPHKRLEVARDVPLMTWHMRCHEQAQALGGEILFTEPDVRFRADVLDVFDDDFDIAVTEREVDSTWDVEGQKLMLSDIAPYTLGTTFSRSAPFWGEVTAHCATLRMKEQNWIGDMLSLYAVMQTGRYNVKVLSGPIYNHIPCSRDDACPVKVLHYKGMRKEWLFQGVKET
jgi:hypothetical protein